MDTNGRKFKSSEGAPAANPPQDGFAVVNMWVSAVSRNELSETS